ncbi:MAG: fluoride efflux transporter CrcB [Deltaproteobacteria bacterium CG11_big_fil_rev_8_21_14_0_20_47_16]|nr:MAG: fluoride efflux transporter CrcB [Deltaproteobacteria bacterium CG11_big_fil_rev_8_21_14_0_20_47_16]
MPTWIWIGVAGAAGALSRYGVTGVLHTWIGSRFQYVTLVINAAGSFVLGFVMEWSLDTLLVPLELKHVITIGFLGAFTTFSTFSFEVLTLVRVGDWWDASVYVILSVFGGLLMAALGVWSAQLLAQ